MMCAFIDAEKANHEVKRLCGLLEIPRSSYYLWSKHKESARVATDRELLIKIETIHKENRELYGSPRVHRELKRDPAQKVSRKRVARLMRDNHIQPRRRRGQWRGAKKDAAQHLDYAPNTLDRRFDDVTRPHEAWVGDGTYIKTAEGWLCLVVFIDLYTRQVVGMSTGTSMTGQLAAKAFQNAVGQTGTAPGLVHTDRGPEYACEGFRAVAAAHGVVRSMSRTGNCWDNAVAESFFATLKKELVYLETFSTRDEGKRSVFEYIQVFYNRLRLHSALGYKSPAAFEAAFRS